MSKIPKLEFGGIISDIGETDGVLHKGEEVLPKNIQALISFEKLTKKNDSNG